LVKREQSKTQKTKSSSTKKASA